MSEITSTDIIFYMLAAVMVLGAVTVVTMKNILHAAIGLIATFFTTAILYLVMKAEFVAMAQIMVYIGGVVIFSVFTILLTSKLGEKALEVHAGRKGIAALVTVGLAGLMVKILMKAAPQLDRAPTSEEFADIEAIAVRLMNFTENGFIVPFEIISVLLLSAMIGAIVIARRDVSEENAKNEEGRS